MYNKDLESDKKVWEQHISNQKKASSARLAKNATWNKAHKKVKE